MCSRKYYDAMHFESFFTSVEGANARSIEYNVILLWLLLYVESQYHRNKLQDVAELYD